jgi:hypothetical protein
VLVQERGMSRYTCVQLGLHAGHMLAIEANRHTFFMGITSSG